MNILFNLKGHNILKLKDISQELGGLVVRKRIVLFTILSLLLFLIPVGSVSASFEGGGGNSGGGGASGGWAVYEVRTSTSGFKIILPAGTPSYGYYHIKEKHIAYPITSIAPEPNGKTQFNKVYSENVLIESYY